MVACLLFIERVGRMTSQRKNTYSIPPKHLYAIFNSNTINSKTLLLTLNIMIQNVEVSSP